MKKSKVKAAASPSKNFRRLLAVLWAVAGVALVAGALWYGYKEPKVELPPSSGNNNLYITEADMVGLTNSLFAACQPGNAENSYFTEFMRQKVNYVYGELAAKRLQLYPYAFFKTNSDGTQNKTTLMSTGYVSKNRDDKAPWIPQITMYGSRLMTLTRMQQKQTSGFNQSVKNSFVLTLVHEAVHLEQPPEFFLKDMTPEERALEEDRAWFKVDINAVRALRRSGQVLDTDFIECDDILLRCKDNMSCVEFRNFVRGTGKPRYDSHVTQ